jgi:exodeoxyribonuclease VII large subunit
VDEWATPSEKKPDMTPRIWAVGALCRAVADALQARFNLVAVRGEISGFTRASSGHCYFTLKDEQGQIRCAMFRRAAQLLDFSPQDGQQVEASGRLSIYEPRGELQIVVESLRRAGQGALFEQFLRLKAKLQEQGLFDADRKRGLPAYPKGIGLVTSLSAAALHDVITALRRRVPHLPVIVANAPVQGAQAAPALVQALQTLGRRTDVDVILLVRGGGSMEDLWAFNDERLAHAIVASPYPVVSGVGHETDFTIADFCADLRAPTPTAAAELCAPARADQLEYLDGLSHALTLSLERHLQRHAQRLDRAQSWLARPLQMVLPSRMRLQGLQQGLQWAMRSHVQHSQQRAQDMQRRSQSARDNAIAQSRTQLDRLGLRLASLDPQRVLQRGYAWLGDAHGRAIASVAQLAPKQPIRATLADGKVDLSVITIEPNGIS